MNAADILDEAHFEWACTGERGTQPGPMQAAALLAHGEQGVAILKVDGSLWNVQLMPVAPSAEGVRRAWLVPVSAEAGDTDG